MSKQFTQEDRDKAADAVELRRDPIALLEASDLVVTPRERKAILQRLRQMPTGWRNLYLKGLAGSPAAAIKSQCGECLGYARDDITKCTAPACPLYRVRPFR